MTSTVTPRRESARQGRRFEWCSRMVVTTRSPGLQERPRATMLMASVVFLVNTVVPSVPLISFATFSWACQYRWVAIRV